MPVELQGQAAVTATLEQIDIVHRMVRKYPETFELALSADDVERIFKEGKIASLIGMEGGHSIDNSLADLRMFYRLGRAVHDADAFEQHAVGRFGDRHAEVRRPGAVRRRGRQGDELARHAGGPEPRIAGHDGRRDPRITQAPVIFSHSDARALNDHPRNVPDNILQMLPKNGGVVMVTFVPGFLSPKVNGWNKLQTAEQDRQKAAHPNDAAAVKAAVDAWTAANPAPRATIADVADHIDHIRKVAGIDHIGIGSDFDGITQVVARPR